MAEEIIRSKEQFNNRIAERRSKSDLRQVREESVASFSHAEVACQVIKVVNSLNMDPFVKKVMTLRVMGPMITGGERSHMSIALELGAPVDDVIQAEEYGISVVNTMLAKVSTPEFVEKFNRDRAVMNAIKGEINKG
jgi:hypothetical protein